MERHIIGFYNENEEYGCFSNWYPAEFDFAGKHYNSVEQYMMYQKVIMFHEFRLADRIMAAKDPAKIKKMGRTRFDRFDSDVWESTCYTIVKRGVRAKFEQNPKLLKILSGTGSAVLAECSRNDKKWGIGVAVNDPRYMGTDRWTGKNYLGRILMEVREKLRTAAAFGTLGYKDARDIDFELWHEKAGTLRQNPKFHDTINAYADTLYGRHEMRCFLYDCPLTMWEEAMHQDMGGGLPFIGFWEMKQDVYDIWRMSGMQEKG